MTKHIQQVVGDNLQYVELNSIELTEKHWPVPTELQD